MNFNFFTELVKAAQQLKEKDSPIKFAKVNGPEEEALLKKMNVKGYPTLFFYRDHGDNMIDYGGGRMANEMVEWVEKKIGPEAHPLKDLEEVKDYISEHDVPIAAPSVINPLSLEERPTSGPSPTSS